MTQPDQKPPQRSEAIEKLIEEVTTHCYGLRDLGTAARAELTAMRDELERVKTEAESLLWNLAGCDTYAMGYGLDGDHDKSAARPALESCRKMALHNVELRTQLAAQSARMEKLERELYFTKVERDAAQKELRHISEVLCGVKLEGDVTLDMVSCFVEGQIDKQSDRADKAEAKLVSLESQCGAMREALEAVGQQLECPARNTTATSHRRDGSVIISSDVRAMVKAALSTK